jgi:hypothetical protein
VVDENSFENPEPAKAVVRGKRSHRYKEHFQFASSAKKEENCEAMKAEGLLIDHKNSTRFQGRASIVSTDSMKSFVLHFQFGLLIRMSLNY